MKYLILLWPVSIWKEVSEEKYIQWKGSKRMGLLPSHQGIKITFNYRGKNVICKVVRVDNDGFVGQLMSDYLGKNEKWYIGDTKFFQFNLIIN